MKKFKDVLKKDTNHQREFERHIKKLNAKGVTVVWLIHASSIKLLLIRSQPSIRQKLESLHSIIGSWVYINDEIVEWAEGYYSEPEDILHLSQVLNSASTALQDYIDNGYKVYKLDGDVYSEKQGYRIGIPL